MRDSITIGVLSDTHGLLRSEVVAALSGTDRILHAGDIGDETVLRQLQAVAPVTAVRGNMDFGSWSNRLPPSAMIEIAGFCFYLIHDLYRLDLDPAAAGIHVVVYGHTHRPELVRRDGVVYLNPGSAGHRRSADPIGVATVRIENGHLVPKLRPIEL